jgi:hypothetical protein
MKTEYYSPQVKEYFEKLLFHRKEILQELDTYLKNTTKSLRTYHIWNDDTDFNDDKYGSKIFKETKEEFYNWQTDNNSKVKCKHLFLALNATNSLRPNHYMRKKGGLIYFWEDCVDLNKFFKIANDITYTPLRYGFSFTFLKPKATLNINPLRKNQQPYIFARAFLLTDGHMTFKSHNDVKKLNSDNRDLVFYNSVKISLTNNTDKMQILLGASYIMFDYDIKNYFYRFSSHGYQSPKNINFFPFY